MSLKLSVLLSVLDGADVPKTDTTSALVHSRFADVLYATAASDDISKHLDDYHHYTAPTLAHLLALILHPPKGFPPANTSLLVIDDLHTLFNISYPRYYSSTAGNKSESAKWAAGRRYSVQGTVMTALKKLAGLYDMAVLVTTGCATRVRAGSGLGAVLVPGVSGTEWDSGVSARLVLFRDLAPRQTASASQNGSARDSVRSARYIGFQQIGALAEDGDVGQVVSFKIGKVRCNISTHSSYAYVMSQNGIEETLQPQATTDRGVVQLPRPIPSPVKTRKRKVEEIADSDEEISSEYGWLDEDEVVAEGLIDEAALEEGEEEPAARLPIDEAAPEEGAEEPLVPQEG